MDVIKKFQIHNPESLAKQYNIQVETVKADWSSLSFFEKSAVAHHFALIHEVDNSLLSMLEAKGTLKEFILLHQKPHLTKVQVLLGSLKQTKYLNLPNIQKICTLLSKELSDAEKDRVFYLYQHCMLSKEALLLLLERVNHKDYQQRIHNIYALVKSSPLFEKDNHNDLIKGLMNAPLPVLKTVEQTASLLLQVNNVKGTHILPWLVIEPANQNPHFFNFLTIQYKLFECLEQNHLLTVTLLKQLLDLRSTIRFAKLDKLTIADDKNILLNFLPNIFWQAEKGSLDQTVFDTLYLNVKDYLCDDNNRAMASFNQADNDTHTQPKWSQSKTLARFKQDCLQGFFKNRTFYFQTEVQNNIETPVVPSRYPQPYHR